MSESTDERYVRDLVARRFGLSMRKIENGREKAPDFELVVGERHVAVLEVKTLMPSFPSLETGWAPALGVRGGMMTKADNGPRRVGSLVHKAAKQLRAYGRPRALVFLNDDTLVDLHDLREAVSGYLDYGTEATGVVRNTASMKVAKGRLEKDWLEIDVYIWMDRHEGRRHGVRFGASDGKVEVFESPEGPFFLVATTEGMDVVTKHFDASCSATPP